MIDRTAEFWKALKSSSEHGSKDINPASFILKSRKLVPCTDFGKTANNIASNITELMSFLISNKKKYVGGIMEKDGMKEWEKDKIDSDCTKFISSCSQSITNLRMTIKADATANDQVFTHRGYVIDILNAYLKSFGHMYHELKGIRCKQLLEMKRLSRLQGSTVKASPDLKDKQKIDEDSRGPVAFNSKNFKKILYEDSDDALSSEDESQFEQENLKMLSDLNSVMDEVKVIEEKVVEIARLQQVFSEQVIQQEHDINMVSESVIHSSENVKAGNEELREAIKNNAGFRVWILFFLVMCSFSLLFLEWYS